ncbi:MAG: type III pantothenate kinase [Firmicutes bacterium]|nr:type III pantothenate kinase [Bacillota bacterium]
MLLAFDVGNTNILIGLFDGDSLVNNWRISTDTNKSADEYGMLVEQFFSHERIKLGDVDDIIISTVVPSILFTLQHMALKYFGKTALVVEAGVKTGLSIKYDNPQQVGADRIVNAVAAYDKYGGPLVLIDFGTATTFCAVTDKGEYLGGTIAPGIKISSDALSERTSKLPNVEIEDPGRTICKTTQESVQAGLVYSQMGLCDFIVSKMKKELADICKVSENDIKVVATGGFADLVNSGLEIIDHIEKNLTLEGLAIIYKKNKK